MTLEFSEIGFSPDFGDSIAMLADYAQIIARGITDAGVTTMSLETGQDLNPAGIADRFLDEFRRHQDALVATPEGALL